MRNELMQQAKRINDALAAVRVTVGWRWFDLWVGAYVDRKGRAVYVCLLPTVYVRIGWGSTL